MDNRYKYENITPSYYSSEDGDEIHLFRILNWYHNYFKNASSGASVLMPIGAMRALRRLGKFANGNAIVISGDKVTHTAPPPAPLQTPDRFPSPLFVCLFVCLFAYAAGQQQRGAVRGHYGPPHRCARLLLADGAPRL